MLAGTDDHLTWLSPVILNLESTGFTHLESGRKTTVSTPGRRKSETVPSTDILGLVFLEVKNALEQKNVTRIETW